MRLNDFHLGACIIDKAFLIAKPMRKAYWTKRFAKVSVPFELRLINGMNPPVPEVTVLIHRITKDRRAHEYRLHIKKVLGFKNWDRRRQKPKR